MSDTENTPGDPGSQPADVPSVKKTSPVRLVLLLAVLSVAIGALTYDRAVARPAYNTAVKDLQDILEGKVEYGDEATMTDKDVREMLDKEPRDVRRLDGGVTVEVYGWLHHTLYVIYKGSKMPLLSSVSTKDPKGSPELERLVSSGKPSEIKEMTPEELENFVPPVPSGAGAGGTAPPAPGTQDDDKKKDQDKKDDAGEKEPTKESEKKTEPAKEPAKKAEPTKEPAKKAEPAKEPVKKAEPAKEPVKKAEPAKEPAKKAEPAKEPAKKAEPKKGDSGKKDG